MRWSLQDIDFVLLLILISVLVDMFGSFWKMLPLQPSPNLLAEASMPWDKISSILIYQSVHKLYCTNYGCITNYGYISYVLASTE